MKFKSHFIKVTVVLGLVVAMTTSALAYGVIPNGFWYTNSSGRNITSCSKSQIVYAKGSITYDATLWGWIPAPSTCYFNLETPAGSLNKPTSVSGSWTADADSFVYSSYSDISGNSVYRFSKSFFVFSSKHTKTVSAQTTSKSYSTGWYTGSVNTGSGHSSDGSSLGSFKTN